MGPVVLFESVTLPEDVRTIKITVKDDYIRVELDNKHRPGYDFVAQRFKWHEINDVEALAVLFDTETVRAFKVLANMLGSIYANKEHYFRILAS